MDLKRLQKNWDELCKIDPLWAILTNSKKSNNRWELVDFLKTGSDEINLLLLYIKSLGISLNYCWKALDFGCGIGRLTQALASHFNETIGIDISAYMIKKAKMENKYNSKCSYILNEKENLSLFKNNCFDFIYTSIVLQHMEPQYAKKYIQEFLRILKPGGTLVFQIPSAKKQLMWKILYFIKSVLPSSLLIIYQKVRKKAKIEMYGIKKWEIIEILEQENIKIIDVIENWKSGKNWISFQYCITKI